MCYNNSMIKFIILICIFLAVYPMIGAGYEQFTNDFNLSAVSDVFRNILDSLSDLIDRLKK
jgi:hypothetical protein